MLDTPSRANARTDVTEAAAIPVASSRVFLGGEDNPLLAPRGVHLCRGKLIVADTGQNRVFIWNEVPQEPHREADVVLGQESTSDTDRNAGGRVTASTLMYPSGLWSDGERLIVCDAWNHRVLIWHRMPTAHGQPADVVVGQRDFHGNDPNVDGIGHPPSARSLNWPYGVDCDGEQLFIADTGNRRVLVYDCIPTENYAAADRVIGKEDFTDRDYDPAQPIWPYSVKLGPMGQMAIADTQYYRLLIYSDRANPSAPTIIGQAGMEDNGQNQFGWFPKANTLNWCYDACFHGDGILVADTGNSRILRYSSVPSANNQPADALLGQATFEMGIENRNSITASPQSLYWPFHLSVEDGLLAIADTGNHRIVLHEMIEPC